MLSLKYKLFQAHEVSGMKLSFYFLLKQKKKQKKLERMATSKLIHTNA